MLKNLMIIILVVTALSSFSQLSLIDNFEDTYSNSYSNLQPIGWANNNDSLYSSKVILSNYSRSGSYALLLNPSGIASKTILIDGKITSINGFASYYIGLNDTVMISVKMYSGNRFVDNKVWFQTNSGSTEFSPFKIAVDSCDNVDKIMLEVKGPNIVRNALTFLIIDDLSIEYNEKENIDYPVYIPNSITPNSDNINDYFLPVLKNTDCNNTYHLEIYNRWGKLVFQSNNPKESWSPANNSSGVFVYKLNYNHLKDPLTGHINVIK